jgi:hypothetical protein
MTDGGNSFNGGFSPQPEAKMMKVMSAKNIEQGQKKAKKKQGNNKQEA